MSQNQPYKGLYNNGGLGQGLGPGQKSLDANDPTTVSQQLTSAPTIPGYFGLGANLRILVSPFLRFDVTSKTTEIIMFNSKNLGAMIVAEKPTLRSWDEPGYSISNIGIEESYENDLVFIGARCCRVQKLLPGAGDQEGSAAVAGAA